MFKINKTLVASAVLLAAGFVAVTDMAQSRSSNPAAVVEARFPSANEAWAVVTVPGAEAPKAAKPVSASCSREHWPYVSDECLSGNGVKRPARTIKIERHIAESAPQVRS
jgi:hypothetical protein